MANSENCPIDKLFSKEETTNYCRIVLLMVDVGTGTLLHLFYSLVPKHTVKSYFASKTLEIEDGKRKKVFDKSQYAKLTCSEPNPDEFDISLLIKLINYFKLSPVKLDSLQTIRNEIVGHKCKGELITQDFESLWVQVETILLNIARCVSGDEEQLTKVKITELKEKVVDVSDREKKIIKAFETCYKEEISALHEKSARNKESIENLQMDVTEIQKDINRLHDVVSESQHPANKQYTLNGNAEENLSAEEWTIFKMLQHDFISYYREELSQLQLSPLFEEEGYAANFFDFYVYPILKIPSQHGANRQLQSTKEMKFHDIFVRNSKPCKHIYISSPAGCGKTSFLSYMALTWCQAHQPIVSDNQWFLEEHINEMRTFRLLFFVYLRDSHEKECDVDIMIQQLLCRLANSGKYANSGFLQKLLSSVKCIILLDGLDEWNHPQEKECLWPDKHIPHWRARPQCITLSTSRPWKLDVAGLKPGEIDQKLELNGLEWKLVHVLICNVVKKLNELHRKDMQAYDFEQELLDKNLIALSEIPVVVMQLLTLWFDNEPLGVSQCEIYSNMIEFLLKRYCKKRKAVSVMEDIEVDDCSRDRQIPMCLQNNVYCKTHMELLSKLATLAYNTLFTDNEELSFVFDRKITKKYLTDQEIEMSLAVGILTQEKVIGKISIRQSHISFIHMTFHEYLAALYVALNPGMVTNIEEKIKNVCCAIEKILEMSQVFLFLSGLCPEVMVNLHEHLRKIVTEDSRTQRYRASCELGPGILLESNEGLILRKVQYTMEWWLRECLLNGHKPVTHLPVNDFFIGWLGNEWSDEYSDDLRSLIVHNPVSSLTVIDVHSPVEIEDILDFVTVFNSIQKMWLWQVSANFVVQLVSQHEQSLSVRPEAWTNLECVTLHGVGQWQDLADIDPSIPQKIVEAFRFLDMFRSGRDLVGMSGDILCSLVDAILQLPKSVHVRLLHCRISQETRDWKEYIRLHPRLTVDNDNVDDTKWWNVKLLQFHTKKD